MRTPGGLFVTGNDTDVGKTYVAAMIARAVAAQGLRVGIYKPAASGCRPRDGELLSDDALLAVAGRRFAGRIAACLPAAFCRALGAAFGGP